MVARVSGMAFSHGQMPGLQAPSPQGEEHNYNMREGRERRGEKRRGGGGVEGEKGERRN